MVLFSLSIFLSAFLLFQIQPMIGKLILPWFGGTPAVWSTAMLFFQVLLTGGYAYAYWLVKRPKQGWIHLAVLGGTIAILTTLGLVWSSPITPPAGIHSAMTGLPVLDVFFDPDSLGRAASFWRFLRSNHVQPILCLMSPRSNPGRMITVIYSRY